MRTTALKDRLWIYSYWICPVKVQEAVHGVTIEECQTALQNHSWNVQKAVHYLKVTVIAVIMIHWLVSGNPIVISNQTQKYIVHFIPLLLSCYLYRDWKYIHNVLGGPNELNYFYKCFLSFGAQVEQLFCLGLKTRVECHKILEMCDWNLELASTQLLDSYGSVKLR